MKLKTNPRKRHLLHELYQRENGVRSPWWTSIWALRHSVCGPRRNWKLVLKTKENSLLEFSDDLMWITKPLYPQEEKRSIMQRICADGRLMPLYKMDLHPRPKEILVYDIPDPVYRPTLPPKEYRPVMCTLRKGSVLTRHDLLTGTLYDYFHLGDIQSRTITPSFMQDILAVKSPKLKYHNRPECFFHFDIFKMHPFALLSSFNIDGIVFPVEEHRVRYGKLRDAEIHDGMLLIMTDKSYNLVYNAQEIIEAKRVSSENETSDGHNVSMENPGLLVTETPPLLFATFAHLDIMGMGACPWTYIHAISDNLLEVRDLQTDDLLEGGRVSWKEKVHLDIIPDYLMFFPDDSNRLIQVKTSELRVLEIQKANGKRHLVEVFQYPEKHRITAGNTTIYSRSGRLLKTKYFFDESVHRALAFDVEMDLLILVILEARRNTEDSCTDLVKATFYDSITYEYLHEVKISEKVDGDIETNRLSVHMVRDILNIVSHKGSCPTVLVYRLQDIRKKNKSKLLKKKPKIIPYSENNDSSAEGEISNDNDFASEGDEANNSGNSRGVRKRRSIRERTQRRAMRHRNARNQRPIQSQVEYNPSSVSSDEWVP